MVKGFPNPKHNWKVKGRKLLHCRAGGVPEGEFYTGMHTTG